MDSIYIFSSLWCILLILTACISRYGERAMSVKDRWFRAAALLSAVLCMAEGAGPVRLFYAVLVIFAVIWLMYIFKCDRKAQAACLYILMAAGAALEAFTSSGCVLSSCTALGIILIYILSLLDKISVDELTGLNNRRALDKYLNGMFSSLEPDDMVFAAMIDIDGFKDINDAKGHAAGDETLKVLAEELKGVCAKLPGRPFLARYGGDEFVIAGSRCTEEDIKHIYELTDNLGTEVSCGISYGPVCAYNLPYALIDEADKLMYDRKRNKRK